jgi:lipopolysaccharide export LptBFGC system permease protein LptF
VRTLDRYFIREVLTPFSLTLLVFTFILVIPPIMDYAEQLIAKGVPPGDILRIVITLLPQALGITIPMALLVGLLIALGKLSGDSEIVAMQACGISSYSLLRPVLMLSTAAAAATAWVMIVAIPDANQRFREITYGIVATRAEHDVKPRVFFEDFPSRVLYVRDVPGAGGWRDESSSRARVASSWTRKPSWCR